MHKRDIARISGRVGRYRHAGRWTPAVVVAAGAAVTPDASSRGGRSRHAGRWPLAAGRWREYRVQPAGRSTRRCWRKSTSTYPPNESGLV
jgi:hypothetical protein